MKKVLLTLGMSVCMTYPALADPTGIPADSNGHAYNNPDNNCIVSVLGVSSGSASLKANFEANTITAHWNANAGSATGGGAYVQNDTTCTYDGDITLPTPPERVGYTFAGWKVNNGNNNT